MTPSRPAARVKANHLDSEPRLVMRTESGCGRRGDFLLLDVLIACRVDRFRSCFGRHVRLPLKQEDLRQFCNRKINHDEQRQYKREFDSHAAALIDETGCKRFALNQFLMNS